MCVCVGGHRVGVGEGSGRKGVRGFLNEGLSGPYEDGFGYLRSLCRGGGGSSEIYVCSSFL